MMFLLLISLYALPFQTEQTLKNVYVSLVLEQATVRQGLNALEKQSEYKFFYGSDEFNTKRKVSLTFHGNMDEALVLLLGQEITYSISGKHIILKKKLILPPETIPADETEKSLDPPLANPTEPAVNDIIGSADLTISGTVTNDANEPLPGVNVILKRTTVGTTTNTAGVFKIAVPDASAILVFSFIGYQTVELSVGERTTMNVMLEPDTETLDEVVVVGYGSVKKSDVTGAVSSISKKSLGDRQVSSIAQLIQGQVAGVDVAKGKIRIRGVTSFNNTDPLYVIDGFIGGNPAT
ncbi:MAG TPA: carboxypeptidase-like regulatory domain-containing protein, partial [Chryseolinea sp.]|nr:carboxypeptidase-like regulatory domain-containing protein [Chryseolinea sp.]